MGKISRGKKLFKRIIRELVFIGANTPPAGDFLIQQELSIGIYNGESPTDFVPSVTVDNPVLTREEVFDVKAGFVADPFMLRVMVSGICFLRSAT